MVVVTIFIVVCVVIAWLRSRDRAGGSRSWRRRVRAMGWGLLLLPIAWIALWLFGVNPATVGLLLLCGAALILAPGVAADLAAVLLILFGLYGLAAAFAVYKYGRQAVNVTKAIYSAAQPQFAVPSPAPKAWSVTAGPVTVAPAPAKITSLHQVVISVWPGGIRPGPWYAALTGTGPQGYVPVLLAAFLFLAFGLWLVPRTLGMHNLLVSRLTSRVQRLAETRTDAVDTAAAELRRVERDLHDGAQARLVALGMSLRAAERLFETSPKAALAMVGEAREMSSRALTELRDLVRGIHPPVLADRGLGDAVRALALETPVTTRLDIDLPGRRGAGGVRRLLRGRRGAGQRGQARPGPGRGDPDAARRELPADRRDRRRHRRRGSRQGQRPAGCGAAAGHVRWHPGGEQPAGRADHRRHRGAVRVVVAEDLFLLRDGLVRLLEAHGFEITAAVGTGPALLRALLTHRPDVAIVDVRLPPSFTDEGLQAALAARHKVPGLPVLVLSQYVEQLYARELLADQAGGVGYLLKDRVFNDDQFVEALRAVAGGGTVHGPGGGVQAAGTAGQGRAGHPALASRARGARADGRGALQQRDRPAPVRDREGGQQAQHEHLRQARPGALR